MTPVARLEAIVANLAAAILDVIREELAARPANPTEPRWLTLEQAGERLGCSPDAVRMRVKRGRLEARRHGRRIYVSATSVDDLGHE